MIILGIDPGSRITGYGVIKLSNNKLTYLGSGAIRTEVMDLPERLKRIYAGVMEIITQFQPQVLAIEEVFMAKNPNSALKLGQARGVAILAGVNNNLPIYEYAARQVKQTVTGTGSADKTQVQAMVMRLLKLNARPQADAADALAIAITHANNFKYNQCLSGNNVLKQSQGENLTELRSRYRRGRLQIKDLEKLKNI